MELLLEVQQVTFIQDLVKIGSIPYLESICEQSPAVALGVTKDFLHILEKGCAMSLEWFLSFCMVIKFFLRMKSNYWIATTFEETASFIQNF